MHMRNVFLSCCFIAYVVSPFSASGRERVLIVGSSTVYPFVTATVERMGGRKIPVVERTGSGRGFQLFCAGIGPDTPDVAMASRAIKSSERATCDKNGVSFLELPIGYGGIIFAQSKDATSFSVTRHQLFLALAKTIPSRVLDGNNKSNITVTNKAHMWSHIDEALPAVPIKIYGPSKTSGTRDATYELVMDEGAREHSFMAKMRKENKAMFKNYTHSIRSDGVYVETGENDSITVQKIANMPHSIGILGFHFLLRNANKIKALHVDGVSPSIESISTGRYPLTRRLYIYLKKEHLGRVPGLYLFLDELTSRRSIGSGGYLIKKGLIPIDEEERVQEREKARMIPPNM